MSNIYAQTPAISLAAGAVISKQPDAKREVQLRSTYQPPGWVFQIAWLIQAVLLGFAGQGIGTSGDKYIRSLWLAFSISLGPTYALSTYLRASPMVPLNWALVQDFAQVVGLFVLLLLIVIRSQQIGTDYNYFLWPTVAWIGFALFLVSSAQVQQHDPNVRKQRTLTLLQK